jgi:antitoxin CcdA
MNRPAKMESPKRATNVSLASNMVEEAKDLGINVSEACQAGLAAALKKQREARWLEENRESLLSWNKWVEENGMPYDEYRHF